MTVGARLDRCRGIAPGFDFLRVALALGVVATHSFFVIDNDDNLVLERGSWLPVYAILPMFFALSGFLIAGSAERLSLKNFLINRGLRIIPALAVEIVASAFVLGAVFTILPLNAYFTDPQTWRYFTNLVGKVNFTLPGVFLNAPAKGVVNSSLWTIPWEYCCYALMSALILAKLIRRPFAVGIICLAFIVSGLLVQAAGLAAGSSWRAQALHAAFYGEGSRLLAFFLAGIVAYQMRHRLPYGRLPLIAAIAACVVLQLVVPARWIYAPLTVALTIVPLTYATVFIGVSPIGRLPLFHRGDYSYGIYLYGFPIQQSVQALLHLSSPWLLTLLAAPAITLFAVFSWHCIEKPILKLRKKFSFVARVRLTPEEMARSAKDAPLGPAPANVAAADRPAAG